MEMENNEGESESPLAELRLKHSKERKDLRARMTAMNHGVVKNDKKRKKEVAKQCEQMENEMKQRHEAEMEELTRSQMEGMSVKGEEEGKQAEGEEDRRQNGASSREAEGASEAMASSAMIANEKEPESTMSFKFKETKRTKTQLKKEQKRAEKEQARRSAAAKDAAEAPYSQGNMEREALEQVLEAHGLSLVEVAPDGDCLYSALAVQMVERGIAKYSGEELRQIAANYIREHREEFLPFLVDSNDEPLNEFEFDEYCHKISRSCARGGSWGGEPELRALSSALKRRVEVLHANGRRNAFGEQFWSSTPLIVTYHKFAFTLGEHYNATTPKLKSILKNPA